MGMRPLPVNAAPAYAEELDAQVGDFTFGVQPVTHQGTNSFPAPSARQEVSLLRHATQEGRVPINVPHRLSGMTTGQDGVQRGWDSPERRPPTGSS